MKTYLRRLWAALRGKQFIPLEMGGVFEYTNPVGDRVTMYVTSVSSYQEINRPPRVTIEAQPEWERKLSVRAHQ